MVKIFNRKNLFEPNVQEFKVNFHPAVLKPTRSRKGGQFQPFNRFAQFQMGISPFQSFQSFNRYAPFKAFQATAGSKRSKVPVVPIAHNW